MAIRVQCSKCSTEYVLQDDAAGQIGKCKTCGSTIRIPGTSQPSEPPAKASEPSEKDGAKPPERREQIPPQPNTPFLGVVPRSGQVQLGIRSSLALQDMKLRDIFGSLSTVQTWKLIAAILAPLVGLLTIAVLITREVYNTLSEASLRDLQAEHKLALQAINEEKNTLKQKINSKISEVKRSEERVKIANEQLKNQKIQNETKLTKAQTQLLIAQNLAKQREEKIRELEGQLDALPGKLEADQKRAIKALEDLHATNRASLQEGIISKEAIIETLKTKLKLAEVSKESDAYKALRELGEMKKSIAEDRVKLSKREAQLATKEKALGEREEGVRRDREKTEELAKKLQADRKKLDEAIRAVEKDRKELQTKLSQHAASTARTQERLGFYGDVLEYSLAKLGKSRDLASARRRLETAGTRLFLDGAIRPATFEAGAKSVTFRGRSEIMIPSEIHIPGLRIVSLLPNPKGTEGRSEQITLKNGTELLIDLAGWHLIDNSGNSFSFSGQIAAGKTKTFFISPRPFLSNMGGTVWLEKDGQKLSKVTYTSARAGEVIELESDPRHLRQ